MNKEEMTPLEHLQFIREYEIDDDHHTLNYNYITRQSLDIIEEELKVGEMERTLRVRLENINYELVKENNELKRMIKNFNEAIGEPQIITPAIETKLEAFEIIKINGCSYMEKSLIISSNDYEEYCYEMKSNRVYQTSYEREKAFKTPQEYETLKEVLL